MTFILIAGLAICSVFALVQWRASAREIGAEQTYPPIGQIVDVDGVSVHALVMGHGPDLVLIHGASGNIRDFTLSLAPRLAQKYRVFLFDRPGLGWTQQIDQSVDTLWTPAATSPRDQSDLLRKAAKRLGAVSPIVVGQSYGATLAWAWGLDAKHDLSGIVSIAGVANPWSEPLSPIHRINGTVLGGAIVVPILSAFAPDRTIKAVIRSIFEPDAAPQGYIEHLGTELSLRRRSMRTNSRQIMTLRPHVIEMSANYRDISVPVEIVHGDADTIVPLHTHSIMLPDQITGAQLTVLEGAGHMPHHTHEDAIIDAIDRVAQRAGLL